MSAAKEISRVIALLRKPLEYAAGLDPGRLQVMTDLERDLRKILDANPEQSEDLSFFSDSLEGLDSLEERARRARIVELVRILDRLDEKKPAHKKARPKMTDAFKELETPVQYVKGVGPWIAEKLEKLSIATVEDLLYHLPARYEDRRDLKRIKDLKEGEKATILAEVMVAGPVRARYGPKRFHVMLSDGSGFVTAKWFKYRGDYLDKKFQVGQQVVASGKVSKYKTELEIHHPDIEVVAQPGAELDTDISGIVPVYPLTEGVYQKTMRRIVANALDNFLDKTPELLPPELIQKRGLPGVREALSMVHNPPEDTDFDALSKHRTPAQARLSYEEFFFLELGLALRRKGVVEMPAEPVDPAGTLAKDFIAALPFELTGSQEKVISDLEKDMARDRPMHRLLQGDVGSGKTVVAVVAALHAIEAGYQVAIMAPTEILAEQHYMNVSRMLEPVGVKCELLTGSVKGEDRERVLSGAASGDIALVVGTHAVIQEKVKFKRLVLGVVDEQHRFGVMQRAKLKAKGPRGTSPHLLVMTATPIPRTLAMTLYGDLAVSVIRELPPGRKPVETKVYRDKDIKEVYSIIREEAEKGRQSFIVYPLVDESETLDLRDAKGMHLRLSEEVFPDLEVGLIHGKMKPADKDKVMRRFRGGEIDVLTATTVIEVGIDVPNASLMVIEHADRFGLSQLHQLRGRVGRGEDAARCLLVSGYVRTEEAFKRLKVMEKTTDGFRIAEEDLAIRGPGEFFGTRQWGLPDFRVASLVRDSEILSDAREDAFQMVAEDPDLEGQGRHLLIPALKRRWGRKLRLGSVG